MMTFESCLLVFVCVYVRVIHKQKWRKSEAVVVTFFIHLADIRETQEEREQGRRESKGERARARESERERATREREKPK